MVLLCKVPRYYETYFTENSESLALASLAAFLRSHGHEVLIFDASLEGLNLAQSRNRLLDLTTQHKPVLIGFSIADMTFIESTFEAIDFLRENRVTCHITLGGHSPTFDFEEILKMCKGIDSIVRYEGEVAVLELVKRLKRNEAWMDVPNIAYVRGEEGVKTNPPARLISALDDLPFPSRDYLPYTLDKLGDIGIVPVAASRGCYNNCGFCSIRGFYGPPEGPLWRTRSVGNIITEIRQLKDKWPDIREIVFVDDLFLGLPGKRLKRMRLFRDELRGNKLELLLSISERVDSITDEIGAIWNQMGVRQILIGLESGIPEILDKLNKGITLEDHQRAVAILEKYEIDPTPSFINFTPWSTIDNITDNTKYFLNLRINLLQGLLNRFQIYRGTPLFVELMEQGVVYRRFPNLAYRTPDKRVDNLYKIVRKSFAPYLIVAYRLKLLERELRFALFEARCNANEKELRKALSYRRLYKELMIKVMEEASGIFIHTAELVRDGRDQEPESIDMIKASVYAKSNQWVRMIESFRVMCPLFNRKRRGTDAKVRA